MDLYQKRELASELWLKLIRYAGDVRRLVDSDQLKGPEVAYNLSIDQRLVYIAADGENEKHAAANAWLRALQVALCSFLEAETEAGGHGGDKGL